MTGDYIWYYILYCRIVYPDIIYNWLQTMFCIRCFHILIQFTVWCSPIHLNNTWLGFRTFYLTLDLAQIWHASGTAGIHLELAYSMWAKHGPGLAEMALDLRRHPRHGPDVKYRYVGHISIADLDPHSKSISNIFD